MLRRLVVLAAFLMLGGCETDEDFWQPYHDVVGSAQDVVGTAWPFGQAVASAPTRYDDARCASVAEQRSADADANGYDDETQDVVYSGTYADCVEWSRQHPHSLEVEPD